MANAGLAAYADVGDPSALTRKGLFVAEGRLTVERLLDARRFEIESVAVTPAVARALAPVLERHPGIPVHVCDPSALEAVTGFDFHRGCLAIARRPAMTLPLEMFAASSRLIALEGVGNPDNVGGLFRVALALGAGGVLLDPASADPLYRKAIRTSMAASLRVPFTRVDPWPSSLDELKTRGFQVLALTPDPEAMSIADYLVEPDSRLILALGSEGAGLQGGTMRYADVRLRIPIDPRADSLSVVVAAGIALSALRPQIQRPNAECQTSSLKPRPKAWFPMLKLALDDGLVLFQSRLGLAEQQEIWAMCRKLAGGAVPMYTPTVRGGKKMSVGMLCLGKHWNGLTYEYEDRRSDFDNLPVPAIPSQLVEIATTAAADAGFEMRPDMCIMNYYTADARLGVHQDKDERPETIAAGIPIVSVSLGDAARFVVGGLSRKDPTNPMILRSGDVLVMGGPSRLRYHGVTRIQPGTAPEGTGPGRFNLTFRQY